MDDTPTPQRKKPLNLQFQKIKETLTWLKQAFPDTFEEPKPLKLRIDKDIFPLLPENISRMALKKALNFYVNRLFYHEAMIANEHRYDLQGNVAGTVTQQAKDFAKQRLETIRARLAQKSSKESKDPTPENIQGPHHD